MDGVMIDETPSHKHLGLTFSKTCSCDEIIFNISEKAWTRVNLLKALKETQSATMNIFRIFLFSF